MLSSGDIYALLYWIESDDEGETENLMNDSGTEFVAEDETVSQSITVWMRWTLTEAALFKFQKHHFPFYLWKANSMIVNLWKMVLDHPFWESWSCFRYWK